MRNHIIVGVDPLTADTAPLELGSALARATGAPLMAVAAYYADPIRHAMAGASIEQELRDRAARALRELAAESRAELLVAGGPSAAAVLHEVAEQHEAGLLVVGSTFRGVVRRIAPGSTAERLLHGASCPVAVAPRRFTAADWAPRRIGAGFVDRAEGREALAAAAALARAVDGALHAVAAVEPVDWTSPAAIGAYASPAALEESKAAAERALRAALDALPNGEKATSQAVADYALEVLSELSRTVDVLVCGSRSYGPLRAVLLGGVSHRLVREAHCPVIVVPRGTEDALEGLLTRDRDAVAS